MAFGNEGSGFTFSHHRSVPPFGNPLLVATPLLEMMYSVILLIRGVKYRGQRMLTGLREYGYVPSTIR